MHLGNAQSNNQKIDSAQEQRIGFASLFKLTSTGKKDKSFKFELNPKAVSFIQSYMEKQGPELIKMKTWGRPYFNLYDDNYEFINIFQYNNKNTNSSSSYTCGR
jgi:membrane-bound lytic murein transglycosylase D